jgi:hypothetical protein
MRHLRMGIAAAVAAGVAGVFSLTVPASAQGAAHHATTAPSPRLFVYTEPGKEGAEAHPAEISFSSSAGPNVLRTDKGAPFPAWMGCTNPVTCVFPGWNPWAPNPTDGAVGAVMAWGKVNDTTVRDVEPPVPYTQPTGGDIIKTAKGNFWMFCLSYLPYSSSGVPGKSLVYLKYTVKGGWEKIPDGPDGQTPADCTKVPTG